MPRHASGRCRAEKGFLVVCGWQFIAAFVVSIIPFFLLYFAYGVAVRAFRFPFFFRCLKLEAAGLEVRKAKGPKAEQLEGLEGGRLRGCEAGMLEVCGLIH